MLLGLIAFLNNVFSAPSSQLTNRYLTDAHDFSNSGVAALRGPFSPADARPRRPDRRWAPRRGPRPPPGRRRRPAGRDRVPDGVLPRATTTRCSGSRRRSRSSPRPAPASRSAPSTPSCSPPRPAGRRTASSSSRALPGSAIGLVVATQLRDVDGRPRPGHRDLRDPDADRGDLARAPTPRDRRTRARRREPDRGAERQCRLADGYELIVEQFVT